MLQQAKDKIIPSVNVGIAIDTFVDKGVREQLLFEDSISTPLNRQREVNFVTFECDRASNDTTLPILLEIRAVTYDEPVIYSAPLTDVLTVALRMDQTRVKMRMIWKTEKPAQVSRRVRLNMRMDVYVSRKSPSFSHINRNPDPPDRTTLAPGMSHVVTKI